MVEQVELAVVGAGPAGLAASIEASELGLVTALVDAYPRPGGQYFKQAPAEFPENTLPDDSPIAGLARTSTRLICDTVAWGLFPDEEGPGYLLCLYGPPGAPRRLRARTVILAPGAYDRPVPFPGWTLPGVMTAGAAQILIKSQRVLPGRRVLLSGTGPLQWALASQLVEGGAEVVAILDANPFPWNAWRHAGALAGQGERLREGWGYWRTLRKARVPLRWGQAVHRAEGDGQVERAVIGPLPVGQAFSRPTATESVAVDTICLGYGFVPSLQLAAQAGVPVGAGSPRPYPAGRAYYVPSRDEWLETSLPGLYVAGDGAGIGGKDVALQEGRLAALAAAARLGRPGPQARGASVRRELARQRRFAATLDRLFPFPPALWDLLTDDTVLCRCEDVTAGEVRRAVLDGATTPTAVKGLTRAGMGRCQGRMCGGAVAHLVAMETGKSVETVGTFSARPPVLPIPLEGLEDL